MGNTNMADERTCEVEMTQTPLSTGSYNDVRQKIFEKFTTL
jgi:hypothetical protein